MPQQTREREEVRWVSDRTKLSVGIASALAICFSIMGATWATRGYLEDWKTELRTHFDNIETGQRKVSADIAEARSALTRKWGAEQMLLWASQLDRTNRALQRNDSAMGLIVPDPSSIPSRP